MTTEGAPTHRGRPRVVEAVLAEGVSIEEAAARGGVTTEVAAGWVRDALEAGQRSLGDVDVEPDPRFSLANERTFLAWNRTALAFIGAGVAVANLLPDTTSTALRKSLALALVAIGGVLGWASYGRWITVQRALRELRPLPTSPLPRLMTVAVVAGAVAGAVLAAVAEGT